jgi:MFS family permease
MLKMQQDLSKTFMAVLALPATALGFALSIQISALSWILLTQYNLEVHDIGLVWAAGPITGIFGQVIIGALSDRVWLWNGRRRPFIVVGGTIAALMLLALPNIGVISDSLGIDGILAVALVVVLSLDFAINVGFNPTRSIIADVTPEGDDRTRGYAWMQTVSGTFGVIALAIGAIWDNYVLIYVGIIVVLLFSIIPPFFIEEPKTLEADDAAAGAPKSSFADVLMNIQPLWGFLIYDMYAMGLRILGIEHDHWYAEIVCGIVTVFFIIKTLLEKESGDESKSDHLVGFRKVLAAHSFSWIGIHTTLVFLPIYLTALMTGVSAMKIGRVKTHTLALAVMTVGYVAMFLLGDSPVTIYVLMAVIGVGWASIISLPFAIFSQKADAAEMGLFMGLFNLSIVLPQLVVSLGISLAVSRADDKGIIFAISAIALALSTIAWTRVRED